MYIQSIKLSNYRSFRTDKNDVEFAKPTGKEGSGLTIVVGPNNIGKSNIFHGMDFLFNKNGVDNIKNKQREADESVVSLDLIEDDFNKSVDEYVQENKRDSFKKLVYQKNQLNCFTIRRHETDKVSSIEIWNEKKEKHDNPAGIDAPVKAWLHFLPLWANTTTEEVSDYNAKSIIGELLAKIVEEIQSDSGYIDLHKRFDDIFGSKNTSTLSKKTKSISSEVSKLIKEQFEDVGISFKADPPKIDQYVKQIKTLVDDGDETEISEKGHGLQRAIMIALIQVYAASLNTGTTKKPFFLFIDEPELYLNPQAQKVLLKSLRKISAHEQVFMVTHSPYFIDWEDYANGAKIGRANKNNGSTEIHWLKRPSDYSDMLSDYFQNWQQPHILDAVAKEILFSEKVLFLEGQEDVGLIKKWLKDNSKEIKFDLFGYGVSGFGNYAAYLQLASDIGLTKVAALYDNGSEESAKMASDSKLNTAFKLAQLEADDVRDKFRACGSCSECKKGNFGACSNRTKYKDGCFDESGTARLKSKEYIDFCKKIEEIISFMGA